MNTFLKIATAASALALISAAAQADNQTVEINGTAPAYCKVGAVDPDPWGTPNAQTSYNNSKATFNFGSDFVDGNGKGRELKGKVRYPITANGTCDFAVSSSNGGFKNLSNSNDQLGAPEPLPEKVYLAATAPADTTTGFHSVAGTGAISGATYNIPNTATPSTKDVYLAFVVPATSDVVNAGVYQEVLTLSITPSY